MRICIFCDKTASTKEHILASWLMDVLAAQAQTAHVVMTIGTERRQPFVLRGQGVGLTVKYLCASCNSGWMSLLETRAKPYVLAMFRDVTIPLDGEAQSTISAWIMKTAMVCEFPSPERAWYSDADRHVFRDTLQLPDGTAVWLGRCNETGWSSTITRMVTFGPGWPFTEGAVATFAFDHLVFQVLNVRMQEGHTAHRGTSLSSQRTFQTRGRVECFNAGPYKREHRSGLPQSLLLVDANEVQQLARRFEADPK
jgi:hypothetical protein